VVKETLHVDFAGSELRLPRQRTDKIIDEGSLNSGQRAAIVVLRADERLDTAIATYMGEASTTSNHETSYPDLNLEDQLPPRSLMSTPRFGS
jgi:hypothetical protein